jgi:hypothetical protein
MSVARHTQVEVVVAMVAGIILGGWAPHRPTFGGHGNRGFINSESASTANGSWGSRDWLGLVHVGYKNWPLHEQAESKEIDVGRGKQPMAGQPQVGSLV